MSLFLLCSCKKEIIDEQSSDPYPLCTHDLQTFTEPEIKTGRYYLNGDTDSYYFEVTNDTLELCGVDLSELFDSWQSWGSNYAEGVSEEVAQARLDRKNEWINEWTGKKTYKVITNHSGDDLTLLETKEVTTQEGSVLYSGLVLKDEITLTSFGDDGDFILAE